MASPKIGALPQPQQAVEQPASPQAEAFENAFENVDSAFSQAFQPSAASPGAARVATPQEVEGRWRQHQANPFLEAEYILTLGRQIGRTGARGLDALQREYRAVMTRRFGA